MGLDVRSISALYEHVVNCFNNSYTKNTGGCSQFVAMSWARLSTVRILLLQGSHVKAYICFGTKVLPNDKAHLAKTTAIIEEFVEGFH